MRDRVQGARPAREATPRCHPISPTDDTTGLRLLHWGLTRVHYPSSRWQRILCACCPSQQMLKGLNFGLGRKRSSGKRPSSFARKSRQFESVQKTKSLLTTYPAHRVDRSETHAHGWAVGPAEDRAAQIRQELHAGNARRFAVRHPGNRRGNRWRDTAGATTGTTVHENGGRYWTRTNDPLRVKQVL